MRTRLFLGVWLCALAVFCSCRGVPHLREEGAAGQPLPEFFGPVTWNSTEAELRTYFPKAEFYNDDFDSQAPDALGMLKLEGARLMPFGDARVRLLRRGGLPTGVLVIEYIANPATCPNTQEEFSDC